MSGTVGRIAAALEQSFSTLPVSIVGKGIALYTLSVRAPGPYSPAVSGLTYTFPMSPQGVRKDIPQFNTTYEVQGPPNTQGVVRLVDMWGQAPPVYTLRGTTGWKLHSNDSFALTGKASILAIQALLTAFATLNQQRMAAQAITFYTLEFYDYWMDEFWRVVPVGPQGIDQTSDKPIISYYTFRLACIMPISAPIPPLVEDAAVAYLSNKEAQAVARFNNFAFNALSRY